MISFYKTPLTDLTGAIVSHQWNSICAELELKTLDCLEAYGVDMGLNKCEDLIHDLRECSLNTTSNERFIAMREERDRQYKAGERTKENRYAEPPNRFGF